MPEAFALPGGARRARTLIDPQQSWMVGDRESDILCGRSAGCSTIWLRNDMFPVSSELPDFIARDWSEVYEKINSDSGA